MAKTGFATITIAALLLMAMAVGTLNVNCVLANPILAMYAKVEITSPQNTTYCTNEILLNIHGDMNYGWFVYSLDGQKKRALENITIILTEDMNFGKNPQINRIVMNASMEINMPVGKHNITVSC